MPRLLPFRQDNPLLPSRQNRQACFFGGPDLRLGPHPSTREAPVHLSAETARTAQARHLQENLIERLEKGREWATPAVESALRRAVAGIDSGIDAASPRLQASLRAIADELAGGVETVTPRLHERIARIYPGGNPSPAVAPESKQPRKSWWIAAVVMAAAVGGAALWRVLRPAKPTGEVQRDEVSDDQPVQIEPPAASPLHAVPPTLP
ncbi:MAG TPA: hypothetical protein VLT34_03015 [Arthrobacter sp.]|nr:hypothetical protein [Arthrobacter sp.]